MKPLAPLESDEAKILVAWLRIKGIKFMHIPSETGGTSEAKRRAIRMKQQGTSRGFPDYCVALPGIGVVYIELKRVHGSVTSPEQKEWVALLNQCPGTEAYICKGAEKAIALISDVIRNPGTAAIIKDNALF